MSENLSLIVPSFNNGKYLGDLISSIFGGDTCLGKMTGQTLKPDEVIIVDDCSTDNTEEIVFDLLKKNSNIRYFRLSKNSGTAIACNVAIEKSVGKYITRIDSDDMRESWSFEKLMKFQLANPHSYIYDNVMIFMNGARKGKEWIMFDFDFERLLERNSNHAGIMFPKKAWEDSGGYPEEFSDGRDDWAFNVALGVAGYCGVHIDGAGYLYRREQQNRTVKNASSEHQRNYRAKMERHFSEIYSGRYPMGCCGNRSKSTSTVVQSTPLKLSLIGAEGMTLLLYEGDNYGLETYFGPVTGTAYVFSKKKNVRNVDNRDLHTDRRNGLLDLALHGKPVFSVYQKPDVYQAPVVEEPVQFQQLELTVEEQIPEEKISDENIDESLDESSSETPIESGQVTYVSKTVVKKLADSGIVTWEQFLSVDSAVLSETTGKTLDQIESIKKEITS